MEHVLHPSPQKSLRRSDPFDVSRSTNSDLSVSFDDKDVVVLGQKNFSKVITENQYVLVDFYAPWCPWSKRLYPEYAPAATMLKGKALLAKVDATLEWELARESKIHGYPTLRFYIGGVYVEDYYRDRTRDAIAFWVKQKISPSIYTVWTTEEAKLALASVSFVVLGFFETLKGEDAVEFAAASKLQPDVEFYQTIDADVAEIFGINPLIKRPALVMVKKPYGECISFGASFNRSDIASFVRLNNFYGPSANSLAPAPQEGSLLHAPSRKDFSGEKLVAAI